MLLFSGQICRSPSTRAGDLVAFSLGRPGRILLSKAPAQRRQQSTRGASSSYCDLQQCQSDGFRRRDFFGRVHPPIVSSKAIIFLYFRLAHRSSMRRQPPIWNNLLAHASASLHRLASCSRKLFWDAKPLVSGRLPGARPRARTGGLWGPRLAESSNGAAFRAFLLRRLINVKYDYIKKIPPVIALFYFGQQRSSSLISWQYGQNDPEEAG
ncbi:Uncharacterised protein [uncultured archaeon]|nr:Uncharacterised protein [uncultured archaeon]